MQRPVWAVSLAALLLATVAPSRVFGEAMILVRPDQRAIPMLVSKSQVSKSEILLHYGTGVIVGHATILTAEHVLAGRMEVRLPKVTVTSRAVCRARYADLAVLSAPLPKGTPYYRVSYRMPGVGEAVRVGGYPDRHWTVARGRVTHVIQSATLGGRSVHAQMIVFEPALRHGASGSPVLDGEGRVVGIFVASNMQANYSVAFPTATSLRSCSKFLSQ